ncbi:MAG: sulfite exporter TauE/SafE family protein [Candidatus Thermoplasmatota archaeon]|jgi:uncharacterized membrane protein YfcA|nr:sulfite exporter TauE/SafE family protein [Candidatus Thermoplasmatota archaeon]MCL5793425.1 sulfite exporter TauE/SafE family protein [Candidatus Thermoplasmatota archaeon]
MDLTVLEIILSLISGLVVGFSLGLIGGGGSILAIPLLIYVVGINDPHVAIGTSALAVGANAFFNVLPHARKHHVYYTEGGLFTLPGIAGALFGAELGILTPGNDLLLAFAFLMIGVAVYMLKRKCVDAAENPVVQPGKRRTWKIIAMGFLVGFASGYFGIGGGFLIVPGLIYAAGLNIVEAVGTSLISVGAFGIVTSLRYAMDGYVLPLISVLFVAGGVAGGWAGARLASSVPRRTLSRIFAVIVILVAAYMIYVGVPSIP